MKKTIFLAFQCIIAFLCVSCEPNEGEGGKSSIIGTVTKIIDNGEIIKNADKTFSFKRDTVPAKDEDVFIIYGEKDSGYNDKTSTAYDGTFKFEYLTDGTYYIFAYSDLASGDKEASTYKVDVNGKTYGGDLTIWDGKNAGYCGVVGQIYAFWEDAYDFQPGTGLRVYIKKEGSNTVEDTRADEDGYFSFAKLDPNSTYFVYAESEPVKDKGIISEGINIETTEVGTIAVGSEPIRVYLH